MAAYTFSYHMNGGCVFETNPVWGDINVQETLLRYRWCGARLSGSKINALTSS
jgi:hypothetical protein